MDIKNKFKDVNEKWKNIQTKHKMLYIFPNNLLLFIISIFLLCSITITLLNNNSRVVYEQFNSDDNVGAILNEDYSFKLNHLELNEQPNTICLKFGTYQRKNKAKYVFQIKENDNTIKEISYNAFFMKDNAYKCFDINGINFNEIEKYTFVMHPVKTNVNNVITLYKDKESNELTYTLEKNRSFISLKPIVLVVIIVLYLIINLYINIRKPNEHHFWFALIIYFLLIMLIIPPYENPDEATHQQSSFNYTQNNYGSLDNFLTAPKNFYCIKYAKPEDVDKVVNYKDIVRCIKEEKNDKLYFQDVKKMKPYGYIFIIPFVKLIDILSNSPLLLFYSGRFINTIISFIIIFFAIKKTPKYKNLILFTATIPMFIQQMTSYSYDSLLNSFSLLLVSTILLVLNNKKNIDYKLLSVISLCLFMILGIKIVYFPIILLLLMTTKEEKIKKENIITLILSSIISVVCYLLYEKMILVNVDSIVDSNSANMIAFKNNPFSIIPLTFKTIINKSDFYYQSMIGYFGWFRYKFPDYVFIIYFVFMILLLISNENKNIVKSRIVPIIGLSLSIGAVFASQYFLWSKPGLNYIDGVQGRYFIPLVLPLYILLLPKNKRININKETIYTFINIMLCYTTIFLLNSYY